MTDLIQSFEFRERSHGRSSKIDEKSVFVHVKRRPLASSHVTSFGYSNFDKSFVEDLMGVTYDEYLSRNASSKLSIVLHNSENELSSKFVEKVKSLAEANDVDLSDQKQIQALKHLMYDRHDALITSQYKDILEDY